MMNLFLNALAASSGSGITYILNAIPQLAKRSDVRTTVAVASSLRKELGDWSNIDLRVCEVSEEAGRRFLFEQWRLPAIIRESRADVLVSAGNFAVWFSPVPQILLSGNSLYTSELFISDLRRRREPRLWLDTKVKGILAAASVHLASVTVAPSRAFAEELRRWTGIRRRDRILTVYHGFDADTFCDSAEVVPPELVARLVRPAKSLRLLFVSHYNYYRNFETLLCALPLIKEQLPDYQLELLLTCKLDAPEHSGSYRTASVVDLTRTLGIRQNVLELGAVPYTSLHQVYRSCDIYVTPAYTETFAHPLVEAMSSGLPVIASDIPVHREICQDAALYFEYSSPGELAQQVVRIVLDEHERKRLTDKGAVRAQHFSWAQHIDEILNIAQGLIQAREHQVIIESQ